MAKRGYDLTALEPGATLADLVRKKLQPHPNTSVITSKLEDAELPNESFDLVYSAMALHWVAEEMRFTKPHRLLRPDGHLAILSHEPVTDEAGDKFFHAFPPIANRYGWGLEEDDFERLPTPEEVYHIDRVPIDTELFEEVDRAVFALELEPRTGLEHALYMHTMASVLAMPERERLAFLGEIKSLIETELNDQLNYRHADMLVIARKK
jgi:SAM-dependent methyltransferase